MRLGRLIGMSLHELGYRGRQSASMWIDRLGARAEPDPLDGVGVAAVSGATDPRLAETVARFFPGAREDRIAARIERRVPGFRMRALREAERAGGGRLDLLGYTGLDFGVPPDWNLDPVSGRRAPAVHWTRLDTLDAAEVGDAKVIWELNRHQWMLWPAQAWRFERRGPWAERIVRDLRSWTEAAPPGTGLAWADSLEVALRLVAWSWIVVLLRDARATGGSFFERLLPWIAAHAHHVARYLSRYSSPNTHLTGEALGLFYAGTLFPYLDGAEDWLDLGRRVLVEEIERQVGSDGVYFEQSTAYQRYTAEIYLHFLILARANDVAVPSTVPRALDRMMDFLVALQRPDGTLPRIGDVDGGWLLPLDRRGPDDFGATFATAAAALGHAGARRAARVPAAEMVWLLGRDGLAAWDALEAEPPRTAGLHAFGAGGYVVMQDETGPDAMHLVFDVGPLGCPHSGGHGHADLLSFSCAAGPETWIDDPGMPVYGADRRWRDAFRSSAVHATLTVDGCSQARPAGPFAWHERPSARLRKTWDGKCLQFADAEHDAYRRLRDPVRHRRRVLLAPGRGWIVVDDVLGRERHLVELRLPLGPRAVELGPGPWARARGASGRTLWAASFSTAPVRTFLLHGGPDPASGWRAPDYGRREPSSVLLVTVEARTPLRIVTVLEPAVGAAGPPPIVPIHSLGRLAGLDRRGAGESLRFDGELLRLSHGDHEHVL